MHIKHITIQNFRGIHSLDIEFGSNINLFIGENGAGKSTIINAIRILLSWLLARIKNKNGRGIQLTEADISKGQDFCLLEIRLNNNCKWRLVKKRQSHRSKVNVTTNLNELNETAEQILFEYAIGENGKHLPIVSNYGVNRAITDIPVKPSKTDHSLPYNFYDIQLQNNVRFKNFFEWYIEQENIDNANYRYQKEYIPDPQLNAVRKAFETIMPEYNNLRVKRKPLKFIVDKDEMEFNINELSDGEKCYLILVADIARQLAIANPNKKNPLEGNGIVMIDEIDLHLHPQWQTEIVEKLKSTFHNCQFFITTHSPFIVSSIRSQKEDHLYIMKQGYTIQIHDNAYGMYVNEILTSFFGIRNWRLEIIIWDELARGNYSSEEFTNNLSWLKENLNDSDMEFAHINLERTLLMKQGKKDETN